MTGDDDDVICLNASLVEWDVTYDRALVERLRTLQQSSKELYENTRKTIQSVVANPLKGKAKTGELRGCRATHIEHLALVWELRSTRNGTPITDRKYLDDLGEIYIHGLDHHDRMTSIVHSQDRPARTYRGWKVTFPGLDVREDIAQLYEMDGVRVRDQDWSQNGVVVRGVVLENSTAILQEQLPERLPADAALETGEQYIATEPP